jgi:dTDP-4-amino-4,6-dideoxygalactose transaminase
MKIPALDMKAQIAPIREEIDKAIAGVIDKGSFILGDEVKKLEEDICKYTGSLYAVGVSNGTDAITLALEASGIKKGDNVLCPAFTYYATASAIVHAGAIPVFVDIDPKTYCISPESVKVFFERKPKTDNRQPKSIIPVHLYGQCADMDYILHIAKEHGLKVIEDTAQAFGAACHCEDRAERGTKQSKDEIMDLGLPAPSEIEGLRSYGARNDGIKKAGTMGDCGTISFFPGKNLGAFGDAGMVLTQDKDIAEKLYRLRNQGADAVNKYKHIYLGHNNRLDAIQAAVLRVKLKYIDSWNSKRAENSAYYNKKLADTGLITPFVTGNNTHIYHQYTLRVKDEKTRDKIVKALQAKDIDSRTFYPIPLHLQPCFSYLGYKKGDFPESENAADKVFSIPVYPELTVEQMDYVVESIKELL